MKRKLSFLLFVIFLFTSCLGVNADIVLNRNGSGTITLQYQISQSLDALGRLDGNERWNTIPVGRADFQRTLDRLPGMRLLSFSSREDEKNINITVKMEFANIQTLLDFMDAGGRRSSFYGDARSGTISLTLNEGRNASGAPSAFPIDDLLAEVFESYSIRIGMTFPDEGSLAVTDAQGRALNPGRELQARGRRVFGSFSVFEILSSAEGINLVFSW